MKKILYVLLFTSNLVYAQENIPKEITKIQNEYNELDHLNKNADKESDKILAELSKQPNINIDRKQFITIVNVNDDEQKLYLYLVDKNNKYLIGSSYISSGKLIKGDYFYTPVNVYEHLYDANNADYRAMGTKNKNGIMGYGLKNKRIWDFGWQDSTRLVKGQKEVQPMRFQMHATDPILEQKLGHPASKGCIRLSNKLNNFLDKYSVLDYDYETNKPDYWVLKKNDKNTDYAGKYLIIINKDLKN